MRNGRKILGVVLVLALAIGLIPGIIFSASAETEYVSVSTFNELQSAVSNGKNAKLANDIAISSTISVSYATKIILDGNGHKLTPANISLSFLAFGKLNIYDG